MAGVYFNPRPADGSMGGAVNPRDRYAFDPKTVSAQADNLPPWVIPAIAGAGIGATGLGLWAMHRASGTPYVPGSYSSPNVPFNVGYGNGLGTPPQVAPTSTAMVPTQMGVAPTGTGITVQGPATGGYQTAELLNTAEGQAVAQRMAQARAGMNPTLGSGQLGLNAAPQASLSSGPLGLNSGQLALPQAPPASLGAADAQLALGAAPTATPSYGSGFTMGEAGPVSSAGRPAVTVAELGRAPASTALEPYYGGPGVTSGGATGGGVYGAAADAASATASNPGFWTRDIGGLASKSFGKWGNIGAAIGIPLASQALAGHLSDPTQAANVRAAGNVAGQGAWLTPMIAGHLGIGGVGTLPGIASAAAGGALAQGFSATDVGNKTINQMRGQDTGNGLGDYAAAAAGGLFGALPLVGRAAEKLGFVNGSTKDTVADVLGGGGDQPTAKATAPVVTPEQRLAQSSPDALTKYASDYGLSGAMTQKLLKNYNQEMVVAKHQGYVTLPVDKDGMVDGTTKAEEYPGAKKVTDAKGNATWVTTNPADIQQAVYERAAQLVPTLGASQDQEEEFFRKQAVMQAQLEQVLPQLYNPAIWGSDPTAQTLAMAESRAIPSRYVQAQALQVQQGYDNQIAQAMQQQQLAQQYPELFGKKNSSSTPTTLDAAMAQ